MVLSFHCVNFISLRSPTTGEFKIKHNIFHFILFEVLISTPEQNKTNTGKTPFLIGFCIFFLNFQVFGVRWFQRLL